MGAETGSSPRQAQVFHFPGVGPGKLPALRLAVRDTAALLQRYSTLHDLIWLPFLLLSPRPWGFFSPPQEKACAPSAQGCVECPGEVPTLAPELPSWCERQGWVTEERHPSLTVYSSCLISPGWWVCLTPLPGCSTEDASLIRVGVSPPGVWQAGSSGDSTVVSV